MTMHRMRRAELLQRIRTQFPSLEGHVIVAAGYEEERARFWQDSTFWYLTGIHEPGAVMVLSAQGKMLLYVPTYEGDRSAWMGAGIDYMNSAEILGFDEVIPLGRPSKRYQPTIWFSADTHHNLITSLGEAPLFVCSPLGSEKYLLQRHFFDRLTNCLPRKNWQQHDISACIADMRRSKSLEEIAYIRAAVSITKKAHEAVAQALRPDMNEAELAAIIDYTFTRHGARSAFPSIVAGGQRATTLHYHDNNQILRDGELVVVDIGASMQGYAADMSRTLPVNGTFSVRQKELYDLVAYVQKTVFKCARPGMFLNSVQHPERSLHHIAVNIFHEHKVDHYFIHSIGHFLGLDVHDVGNNAEPLRPGDVITIEPGLYIRQEGIGIRIEDDYLITDDGAICLSDGS